MMQNSLNGDKFTHFLKAPKPTSFEPIEAPEISLVDFVDDYPSRDETLLKLGAEIVRQARHEAVCSGRWPTLTPDMIFVRPNTDTGRKKDQSWSIRFAEYGAYSLGETSDWTSHRVKSVRDIYRIVYFLGTGEFPLDVDPLLGRPFKKSRFPNVPGKFLKLYRQFFAPNPSLRPRTLSEVQHAVEDRIGMRSWFPVPVAVGVGVVVATGVMVAATKWNTPPALSPALAPEAEPQKYISTAMDETATIEPVSLPPKHEALASLSGSAFPNAQGASEIPKITPAVTPLEIAEPLSAVNAALTPTTVEPVSSPELQHATLPRQIPGTDQILPHSSVGGTEKPLPELLGELGLEYIQRGTPDEVNNALEWLRKAHELGNHEATYLLAECHFFGIGVEKDQSTAVALLRQADESGSSKAATMLGTVISKGNAGVDQDFELAREFFKKAIQRGSVEAFGNLGVLQLRGQGGEQDIDGALKSFEYGAGNGDPVAAFYLAKCLESGIGGETDFSLAAKWYATAAKKGHQPSVAWCRDNDVSFASGSVSADKS